MELLQNSWKIYWNNRKCIDKYHLDWVLTSTLLWLYIIRLWPVGYSCSNAWKHQEKPQRATSTPNSALRQRSHPNCTKHCDKSKDSMFTLMYILFDPICEGLQGRYVLNCCHHLSNEQKPNSKGQHVGSDAIDNQPCSLGSFIQQIEIEFVWDEIYWNCYSHHQ